MSPEEKATKLVGKYVNELSYVADNVHRINNSAKSCAIICCDEIIELMEEDAVNWEYSTWGEHMKYWQSVKQHIQSL